MKKPWDYDLCTVIVDLDVIFIGTVREFYFSLFCLGLSTINLNTPEIQFCMA